MTIGDALSARPSTRVLVEGVQVDTISTAFGQFVTRTYRAAVADGRVTVEVQAVAAGGAAMLNALEIVAVTNSASASLARVDPPTDDESGPMDGVGLPRRPAFWPEPLIGRPWAAASERPARRLLQRGRVQYAGVR